MMENQFSYCSYIALANYKNGFSYMQDNNFSLKSFKYNSSEIVQDYCKDMTRNDKIIDMTRNDKIIETYMHTHMHIKYLCIQN